MRLIVGLGNPGPKYAMNRHNVGFMVVDHLVDSLRLSPWRDRFNGLVSEGRMGDDKVLVLKPLTFMNDSGRAVATAARFFKIAPAKVIVFHDELDLAPGKIRVKHGGGSAGHNGLRSIDQHLGRDYWRVRIGVGHPGTREQVIHWVLKDFPKSDQVWLDPLVAALADELPVLVGQGPEQYMTRVAHVAPAPKPPAKPPRAKPAALVGAADAAEGDGAVGTALKAAMQESGKHTDGV